MSQLVSIKEVCRRTSLSRTTLWSKIKSGEFPEPVQISNIRKAFLDDEVEEWIAERVAERDEIRAE